MRCWITALLGISCLASTYGCAGFSEYRRDRVHRRRASELHSSQIDTLWKQGYGFNNPNNDRFRAGRDPVNFDGKTDSERRQENGYFGELFGDMMAYGTKSIFTAIVNIFRR